MHLTNVEIGVVVFNRQFFIYLDGSSIGVSLNIRRHTLLTKNDIKVIFCRFHATSNFCSLNYFEYSVFVYQPCIKMSSDIRQNSLCSAQYVSEIRSTVYRSPNYQIKGNEDQDPVFFEDVWICGQCPS